MTLLLGLLFGAVGTVYLAYARRQHDPMLLVCGVVLIILPYLFENVVLMLLTGLAVALFPVAKARGWI